MEARCVRFRLARALARCVAAGGLALLAACASPPPHGRVDLLDFLQDGTTRRADVQLRLGEPAAMFEGERILAYRLGRDAGGYLLLKGGSDWRQVRHNLMLVFDPQGVLQRHSLVDIESR